MTRQRRHPLDDRRQTGAALDVALSPEHRARLEARAAAKPFLIDNLYEPARRLQVIFGRASVRGWSD